MRLFYIINFVFLFITIRASVRVALLHRLVDLDVNRSGENALEIVNRVKEVISSDVRLILVACIITFIYNIYFVKFAKTDRRR